MSKKIWLAVFAILLIFLFGKNKIQDVFHEIEKYDFIMFCNDSNNNYVLLDLYHKQYLFLIEDKRRDISLNNIDYIILLEDYPSLLELKQDIYVLDSNQKIGSLDIKKEEFIWFLAHDYRICFYSKPSSYSKELPCDFLYLSSLNYNISLNKNIKVLIYNQNITFSNHFLEKIYLNWIDIYPVNQCLKIEFQDEDFVVLDVGE